MKFYSIMLQRICLFCLSVINKYGDKRDAISQKTHPAVIQPWRDLRCKGRYSAEDNQESNSWLASSAFKAQMAPQHTITRHSFPKYVFMGFV